MAHIGVLGVRRYLYIAAPDLALRSCSWIRTNASQLQPAEGVAMRRLSDRNQQTRIMARRKWGEMGSADGGGR
jgi:hypothetical protein